jgi:hypothetical protein
MQRKAKINMILSVVSCVFTSLIFLDQNSNAQPRKTEKKLTMVIIEEHANIVGETFFQDL